MTTAVVRVRTWWTHGIPSRNSFAQKTSPSFNPSDIRGLQAPTDLCVQATHEWEAWLGGGGWWTRCCCCYKTFWRPWGSRTGYRGLEAHQAPTRRDWRRNNHQWCDLLPRPSPLWELARTRPAMDGWQRNDQTSSTVTHKARLQSV